MDFSVRRGRGTGATVDFVPGFSDPDWNNCINIDEDAFFLIEDLAATALPSQNKIDHYGGGAVEIEHWNKALAAMEAECEKLLKFASTDDYNECSVLQTHWIAPHEQVKQTIRLQGEECVRNIIKMIQTFTKINRVWADKYPKIFYFGV